jgi:histidine triad (HIT) family protein
MGEWAVPSYFSSIESSLGRTRLSFAGARVANGSTEGCVFCAIAAGTVPAQIVRQDEVIVAFHDLHPRAPTHVLIIPRKHLTSVDALDPDDPDLAGRLLIAAGEIARSLGLMPNGYRVVANTGGDGGQTVPHLHLHLLGGRTFSWPPG